MLRVVGEGGVNCHNGNVESFYYENMVVVWLIYDWTDFFTIKVTFMSMSVLMHGFYTVHKHKQPQALFLDLLTFIKIIYHCGKNSSQSYPNHSYNTFNMKRIYHLTDKLNLSLVLGGSLKRPDIYTMMISQWGLLRWDYVMSYLEWLAFQNLL